MAFKFVANSVAILSLASSAIEAGKKGFKKADSCAKTSVAVKDIQDYTGDSLLNKPSEKYNAMKEIVRNNDVSSGWQAIKGGVLGFVKGAFNVVKDNIVSVGFAILTLAANGKNPDTGKITKLSKGIKTVGVIGCGASMAWDFIKNGTNLFTKKDVIEK